jgi:hypothetical protein
MPLNILSSGRSEIVTGKGNFPPSWQSLFNVQGILIVEGQAEVLWQSEALHLSENEFDIGSFLISI